MRPHSRSAVTSLQAENTPAAVEHAAQPDPLTEACLAAARRPRGEVR